MSRRVLILGANSDMALALARILAKMEKTDLYLASRRLDVLTKKAKDLELRFEVKAAALAFEATDYASHTGFYDRLDPKPDGVMLAFGFLGDQKKAQTDFSEARKIIEANLLGAISILEIVAADFEKRGHGFIIALSSVAGLRGRASNYIYGAAKGGLSVYLSGLRNRLAKRNVQVLTVLPGFVRTKMTEGMDLNEKLLAEPEEAAADIYRALRQGRDVVYTKGLWRWIMLLIRLLPEGVFKKTSL